MSLRTRTTDRGASMAEYAALLALVAVLVGAVIMVTPSVGESITAGIQRSICTIFGGDCATDPPHTASPQDDPSVDDEAAVYPEPEDESLGEGTGAPDNVEGGGGGSGIGDDFGTPRGPVDQDNVDAALDTIDDYLNPPFGLCFWCSRTSLEDLIGELDGLSEAELHEVIASLSEDELRDLLGPAGALGNPSNNALRQWLLENAHLDTLRLINEIDHRYFEPDFHQMDPDSIDVDGLEYGFPEGASVWGEDERVALEHVDQGTLSDCYFLADIAAIARARPDLIEEMITDNGNGTYTVTFADGSEYVVTPDVPLLPDGRPAFAGRDARPPVLWPAILEKAYVLHQGGDYEDLQQRQGRDPLSDLVGVDSQVSSSGDVTIDELHEQLHDRNGTVNLSTYQIDDLPRGDRYDHIKDENQSRQPGQGLYTNHVYVVTDVDVDNGTVTVYNPHGKTDRPITLDWDEFEDSFKTVRMNNLE